MLEVPRTVPNTHHLPIFDVARLKRRLIVAWSDLPHRVIDEAIDQWRGTLRGVRSCVRNVDFATLQTLGLTT